MRPGIRVVAVTMLVGLTIPLSCLAAPAGATVAAGKCGKPHMYQNGTVGPYLCPDGQPNTLARAALTRATPRIMHLPAKPKWTDVKKAICADMWNSSIPMVSNAYEYQYARYQWGDRFVDPDTLSKSIVSGGLCD